MDSRLKTAGMTSGHDSLSLQGRASPARYLTAPTHSAAGPVTGPAAGWAAARGSGDARGLSRHRWLGRSSRDMKVP